MNPLDKLYKQILDLLPNAELGEDNEGQIVIYTGLKMGNKPEHALQPLEDGIECPTCHNKYLLPDDHCMGDDLVCPNGCP